GQEILKKMRTASRLPVVTRPKGRPGTYQRMIADLEYRATSIWENLVQSPELFGESGNLPVRPV
ncbi:MAG TPA: nucleotidyltransferase, partial [Synergistaceae bacterium]|nr:nucleotidyltransferase [Synergistaceae bacterium]